MKTVGCRTGLERLDEMDKFRPSQLLSRGFGPRKQSHRKKTSESPCPELMVCEKNKTGLIGWSELC